jgi:signal recognition particle receptor subunit beta
MVQFNLSRRELTLKVVYYGPALSGKTSNLQAIHQMVPQDGAGRLMTLETRDDRTLFFDLLPVYARTAGGAQVKIKLFTVPGQVIHESTRRVVLQGTDAVVFVADSQLSESEANKESFKNLRDNLAANNLDIAEVPLVLQFNKRDLPDIRSEAELRQLEARRRTPIHRAVAINGQGVMETLRDLLRLTFDKLERTYELSRRLGTEPDELIERVFEGWNPARVRSGGGW